MRLLYSVVLRLSIALICLLTAWAVLFYVTMVNEINDEVDDSLEDYSETIIIRSLAGKKLPSSDNGSNNQYYLRSVSTAYAEKQEDIRYADSLVYIVEKREKEPARVLTTIFQNDSEQYYELVVFTPSFEKNDLKQSIFVWIVVLYAALLLVIILVNIWVFYRNMRPLYILLHWLDNYKIGKAGHVALDNPTNVTEFRKLNEAAIRYAERSERLFEEQKQFISNASHEIQTPLAISLNRLEMMMEDETLGEHQLVELLKTHQALEHITRLTKTLLLLSKIDNGQFTGMTDINVNGLVKQYLNDYEEVYEYRNIHATILEQGIFHVHINESLAAMLFTNLLRNAFVHNIAGGKLDILFTSNYVIFSNTGTNVILDGEKIFNRFYKGTENENSTGLGLAIVHSICKMQGLVVDYFFEREMHHFKVSKV